MRKFAPLPPVLPRSQLDAPQGAVPSWYLPSALAPCTLAMKVLPAARTVTPGATATFSPVVCALLVLPVMTLLPGDAALPRSKPDEALPAIVTPELSLEAALLPSVLLLST